MKICDLQAFLLVPIKVFICKFCFIALKDVSICHRILYNWPIVAARPLQIIGYKYDKPIFIFNPDFEQFTVKIAPVIYHNRLFRG
jgi:hypothetical protein